MKEAPAVLELRSNPRYRSLLIAIALGATASGAADIGLDLVAVLVLNATALQVGVLNALGTACYLLFSIPAGVLADRAPKHVLMAASDTLVAVALVSIPIAYVMDSLSYIHLAVVTVLVGFGGMFFSIASQSVLPHVVDESQLPLAYSRQESITTAIQLAAPALVGQALRVIAAPFALVLAAVCRLVSAFFSYRVKVEGKDAPTEHDPFWESLREGVRFSLRNKPVMIIMFSLVFVNFGLALGSAVETIYYVRVLDLGPASIGAVLTSAGLGGLIGSLAAPRLVAKVSQAWCLAGALCLLVPVVASLPLLSYLEQGTLPLLAIQTFLYSFLIVIFNINSYTLVTTLTPKRLVGRQLSFVGFASMGVVPVGSLMGGFSGDVFGLEQTLWIWVAVSILAALPVVIGRKRIESSETPA